MDHDEDEKAPNVPGGRGSRNHQRQDPGPASGRIFADRGSDFLDIRYQHVRKVAVDAGINEGLQRGIMVLPEPKAPARVREDVAIDVLVDAGFTLLGSWVSTEAGIGVSVRAPRDPGVYAFVVGGSVKYIGLTKSGFHRRMYNYQKPGSTQRTSQRLNEIITEQLGIGAVVDIYIAAPPALEWNGLPVHTAVGLESALIEMIQPPWNKMGVGVLLE
ncbi:GIY-YIG nuclease family protein [Mesorhizobium sp.]|uniref:GIY-YIG nuclease family protein n=1 Tax=Mesorhizobium sp. TaxID=1871066 RepID=UPI00122A94C2|nr:GIY-YIG nuclease family protein [Mesorhizobium sp.]TIP11332.1 MAG: GIY-YIG nuclease family protein [Mesorhizobium sp.]